MRLLNERIILGTDALEHRNWFGRTDRKIPYDHILKIETKLGVGRSPTSYTVVSPIDSLTFDESLLDFDRLADEVQARRAQA